LRHMTCLARTPIGLLRGSIHRRKQGLLVGWQPNKSLEKSMRLNITLLTIRNLNKRQSQQFVP
jgi:hypothetical protein